MRGEVRYLSYSYHKGACTEGVRIASASPLDGRRSGNQKEHTLQKEPTLRKVVFLINPAKLSENESVEYWIERVTGAGAGGGILIYNENTFRSVPVRSFWFYMKNYFS